MGSLNRHRRSPEEVSTRDGQPCAGDLPGPLPCRRRTPRAGPGRRRRGLRRAVSTPRRFSALVRPALVAQCRGGRRPSRRGVHPGAARDPRRQRADRGDASLSAHCDPAHRRPLGPAGRASTPGRGPGRARDGATRHRPGTRGDRVLPGDPGPGDPAGALARHTHAHGHQRTGTGRGRPAARDRRVGRRRAGVPGPRRAQAGLSPGAHHGDRRRALPPVRRTSRSLRP
jgi:hypothetical protein